MTYIERMQEFDEQKKKAQEDFERTLAYKYDCKVGDMYSDWVEAAERLYKLASGLKEYAERYSRGEEDSGYNYGRYFSYISYGFEAVHVALEVYGIPHEDSWEPQHQEELERWKQKAERRRAEREVSNS